MFFAIDNDGKRTSVNNAMRFPDYKKKKYYCPFCRGDLRIRAGSVKVEHFAHKSLETDCVGSSNDMSEWHRRWQAQFPEEYQELIIKTTFPSEDEYGHIYDYYGYDSGREYFRRADVVIGKVVLEFQNSPISKEEFTRRNIFYEVAGYHVIWIFNAAERDIETIKNSKDQITHTWRYATKTLSEWDYRDSKAILFLELENAQTDDLKTDNALCIERVRWVSEDDEGYNNWKRFITDKYPSNYNELVAWIQGMQRKTSGNMSWDEAEKYVCRKCGRDTKYRPAGANYEAFIGCTGFPNCNYTREIRDRHYQ